MENAIKEKNGKQNEAAILFPAPINPKFTFIDLFAGIGGFRLALQSLGGKCAFTSEWDKYAQVTYHANFGEVPLGDITKIQEKDVPNHDILCGGFPCQAFSIAGFRQGFEDTRGTLFFDIARILAEKRPKAFLLENVKGLSNHKGGKTLSVILKTLRDMDYYVPTPKIIRAEDFGVPQKRERIFIVGFHKKTNVCGFKWPAPIPREKKVGDILEKGPVSSKFYVSTQYLAALKAHRARHENKGNGFGYEIIRHDQVANTIVIGGMGKERNLVIDHSLKDFTPVTKIVGEVNREGIRRMTPREWARLQGYPDEFRIVCSNAQAYKQFANSVAVPVIQAVGKQISRALDKPSLFGEDQISQRQEELLF